MLLKLLYPNGEACIPDADLEWANRLALECRRRVKEQQKRIGSAEFRNTQFSYRMGVAFIGDIAWHVIQNLAFVLNYISLEDRLAVVFKPISPPPYLNGGPADFLSWVIEAQIPHLNSMYIADVLRARLPNPIGDEAAWIEDEQELDEDDK